MARPTTGLIGTPAIFTRSDTGKDLSGGTNLQLAQGQLTSSGDLRIIQDSYRPTFDAAFSFAPAITTATDLAILNGSATATVKVTRVEIALTDTAGGTSLANQIGLTIRSTANVGGTSTAVTAAARDTSYAATTATAVLLFYTAPASTLGTKVATIRTQRMQPVTNSATLNGVDTIIWTFPAGPGEGPLVLRGAAQGLAITNIGAALTGTTDVFDVNMTWTEEPTTA